jgi:hypothetical protein
VFEHLRRESIFQLGASPYCCQAGLFRRFDGVEDGQTPGVSRMIVGNAEQVETSRRQRFNGRRVGLEGKRVAGDVRAERQRRLEVGGCNIGARHGMADILKQSVGIVADYRRHPSAEYHIANQKNRH